MIDYLIMNDGRVRGWMKNLVHAEIYISGSWEQWITTVNKIEYPEDLKFKTRLSGNFTQT